MYIYIQMCLYTHMHIIVYIYNYLYIVCVYVLYVFMILSMILEGSMASAKRLLAERLLLYSLKVGHKFLDMKDAPIWPHPPHILDGTVSAITDG